MAPHTKALGHNWMLTFEASWELRIYDRVPGSHKDYGLVCVCGGDSLKNL